MSTEYLRQSILRCEHRLALGDYGLMKTEYRVREAMSEYQTELDKRKQTELDFK
uniref:hypothetical protein n=1 Tax=uncultured Dysgonomonas sp. TaxID=206096 RepID=UPI002638A457|nr:hypothetical protein [uncultured Dysgonomonas sp.]